MEVAAVDWSGQAEPAAQRRHIWTAVARDGRLLQLYGGLTRDDTVRALVDAFAGRAAVVGLDFNFSFPRWFLDERGIRRVEDLWRLAGRDGEGWLAGCQPPFWGRPGRTRPDLPEHLRVTERAVGPVAGIRPKSVFQIGGAGAVGTGSVRGMPHLLTLRDAGFAVWPFDRPALPMVVEIYPRALTGPVNKSSAEARRAHLALWDLPADLLADAVSSEDAFDAAVSALVMSRHAEELCDPPPPHAGARLEGAVWLPSARWAERP